MDNTYRPQSPDLSGYAPQSPDLSAYHHLESPDLSGAFPPAAQHFGHQHPPHSQHRFGSAFADPAYAYAAPAPTSIPAPAQSAQFQHPQYDMPPPRHFKGEDDDMDMDYLADAPAKRARKSRQSPQHLDPNGFPFVKSESSQLTAPLQGMSTQTRDPTLGVQLKTSFPVARIKRIMQADEDVGKVAQVTPHVVSRALELFMIKLISESALQARDAAGSGAGKAPRRVLAQHLKKAIKADVTFDFLAEIVSKVPDAPSKAKKEAGSDSEEGGSSAPKGGKKRGKKRKDSGDDF